MRESNFAFPAQNRACVCISSQLYDRRALDTNSPLPLFNSLTHLTYLTSTSPRIREIMTFDGGLERLVQILRDFCLSPPPPENPALIYGLSPVGARPPKRLPTLNPLAFDKHAAYRFSLAFQCVVNIGVRGSEEIRGRVVQAGTLDVVGCILEAWLASKGFAVGPSTSASGLPRESREQRLARRAAQAEQRQRQQAVELARALQRQIEAERMARVGRDGLVTSPTQDGPPSSVTSEDDTPTDTSSNATPVRSGTPTGSVTVPGRERSGTIIGRPVWDQATVRGRVRRAANAGSSTDTSRAETETEDDADADVDMGGADASPSPEPRARSHAGGANAAGARRAVGIVSDDAAPQPDTGASLEVASDAHIIINPARDGGDDVGGVGVGGVGVGVGMEDGIVSLEPNDDFALGAPPGAPGAIDGGTPAQRQATVTPGGRNRNAPDITPRAAPVALPVAMPMRVTGDAARAPLPITRTNTAPTPTTAAPQTAPTHHHHHHHREGDGGPYRDEDVLLGLQLLAYLSKYPHVRQAFYKPRTTFHPATAALATARQPGATQAQAQAAGGKEGHGFFRAFATGRMREKAKATHATGTGSSHASSSSASSSSSPAAASPPSVPPRQTNVFSLVERFTFRPSSSETELPNAPPTLPPEIQYWAGVIMRNACRKDENQGGIRQCANMLCGKWESYPREFAKCRRCRKAKYCGKECQSTAWSEGHRFWCSAKENDDEAEHIRANAHGRLAGPGAGLNAGGADAGAAGALAVALQAVGPVAAPTARPEARRERRRAQAAPGEIDPEVTRAVADAFRATGNPRAMLADGAPGAGDAEDGDGGATAQAARWALANPALRRALMNAVGRDEGADGDDEARTVRGAPAGHTRTAVDLLLDPLMFDAVVEGGAAGPMVTEAERDLRRLFFEPETMGMGDADGVAIGPGVSVDVGGVVPRGRRGTDETVRGEDAMVLD